ncbi:MAG: hypothetical protein BWY69_00435 [Planctomycetes bacterium ADurb.Bin401]|nr:MAG: hypothetical protein BWY69_00435 [Planctomycetes bacterium ADurb.Bin401]
MRRTYLFLTIILCALLFSSPLFAVLELTAECTIDWSSLTITNMDKINWDEKHSEVFIAALDDSGMDNLNRARAKWSDISVSSELTNASAEAIVNNSAPIAASQVYRTEPFLILPESYASFVKGGFFTVTEDCILTFAVNYTIFYEASLDPHEYEGDIYAFSEVSLDNNDDELYEVADFEIVHIHLSQGHIEDTLSGKFIVSVAFNAGDTGYFGVTGLTNTYFMELPEPSTICILGFGLLTLIAKKK